MRSHGMSARGRRRLETRQEGDSLGHGIGRSSFLEPPAQSFLRVARPQIGKGPWKLPEPWTPRTRPPLLGKPLERVFHELPQAVSLVQKGTFLFR